MDKKHYNMMNWEEVESIIYSDCDNPFSVLGVHKKGKSNLIQTFFPGADSVEAVFDCDGKNKTLKLEKVDESGFFAEFFSFEYSSYFFNVKKGEKNYLKIYDPYAFDVKIDSLEYKSMLKGKSSKAHSILGTHKTKIDGIEGYEFVLYAPFATVVSLVGSFNEWFENADLMQRDKKNPGIFYLFVPGLKDNSEYKYLIKSKGFKTYKNDPFSLGIKNGNSLTVDIKNSSFIKAKPFKLTELQILEVDLREQFERYGDKENVLKNIEECVSKYSYNTVNVLSLLQFDNKNVTNLFSLDLNNNSTDDYEYVISGLKNKNIKVLYEHQLTCFSLNESGLSRFDSSFLFENDDYRLGSHKYYDAMLPDYSKAFTKSYALSSIDAVLSLFSFDGIVFSDLGVMLYHDYNKNPGEYITENKDSTVNSANVSFIKEINAYIHENYKNVCTIASIYAVFDNVTGKDKNSLGFDYCLNTGAMDNILDFFSISSQRRRERLDSFILFSRLSDESEKYIFPFSHVEKEKYANLLCKNDCCDCRLAELKLAHTYKLLFDGSQMSDIDMIKLYDSNEDTVKYFSKFMRDLRKLYLDTKSEGKSSLSNIKTRDNGIITSVFSTGKEKYLLVFNFFDESFSDYHLKVENEGVYTEHFNTDKKIYGGSGIVNKKDIETKDDDLISGEITLNIPALSLCAFKFRGFTKDELENRYQKRKARTFAYVDEEKKKIIDKLNADILELKNKADEQIGELEKLLKPYDR